MCLIDLRIRNKVEKETEMYQFSYFIHFFQSGRINHFFGMIIEEFVIKKRLGFN